MSDAEIPESATVAVDRLFKHLPVDADLTLIVLKGHLILEERLYVIVETLTAHPEFLEEADMKFHRLLNLTRAFANRMHNEEFWAAMKSLNTLRNKLAHKLEPADLETRVQKFLSLCRESAEEVAAATDRSLVYWPDDEPHALENAICYLHSQLVGIADVATEVRESIAESSDE